MYIHFVNVWNKKNPPCANADAQGGFFTLLIESKAAAAPMSPPGCACALPEQGTSAPDGGGGEGEAHAPSVQKSKWD